MKKRIFAFILSITLLFSTVVIPVSAEGTNTFTVKVSDAAATAGDSQVAVDILLENNPGIAGFSFCVNFDTDKLILVESKINIEDGHKVIAQPTDYGVNLAWTSASGYTEDGKIATLYFNIPKDLTTSEAAVEIVYRDGYDSFYEANEKDIAVQTVNGKIVIEALRETSSPSISIGGVSTNFGATDIVVPITVKNNPGVSGFSFCVNYDSSRLVLESADILLDGGYEVIGHPDGYGVNIAWTSTETYTVDGTIAELHFSLTDNANSGKAFINAIFREGYDSFYSFTDGQERDIAFESFNGYVDVNNHHFGEWVVTTPASCTSTGIKTRTCSDCSKVETVVIPKSEHEYETVVTAPTCLEKGYTTHTCKTCPDYYIDTYVDMVSHIPGDWEQSVAPECEVKGEEIQKCTVCQTIVNTREIEETGHAYDEWYTITEATFNVDGEERRDCKNCEHYESKRLPKLSESHTCSFTGGEEIIDDATCIEDGSKKVYCSETECGQYTTVVIPALGHSYGEWYTFEEATFDEDGEQRRDCEHCEHYESNRIPKLSEGHICSFTGSEEVVEEPSCSKSGSKKIFCSNSSCGKYTTVSIEPTGHTNGEWEVSVEATCTETGTEIIKCTVCHVVLQSRTITATGHSWDEGTTTKEPNCLNGGEKTYHCDYCAETKIESIDSTGHTEGEWKTITDATCTVAGTKEKRCIACNALIATETIVASGHSFGDWYVYSQAQFHTDGEERKDCSNCDYYESRRIPKLSESHTCVFSGTEEIVNNATCTESGLKKIYCYEAECGKYTTLDIEPTGHNEGKWEVSVEHTCTENGTEVIKCTVCHIVLQSRTVSATGHSWDEGTVKKQPNCLEVGQKKFVCSECGDEDIRELPKTGHTEGEWAVITDATCTTSGTKELHCLVCNELIASETIVATGHTLGGWTVRVEPTETEPGESVRSCSECDYEETAVIEATGPTPKIIVDSVSGTKGGIVSIAVSLENNPGIASMTLDVHYDSAVMTLKSVSDLGRIGSAVHSDQFTNPYVLCWVNDTATQDYVVDGNIVILMFEINETADLGEYSISVSYDYDKHDIYNTQVEDVKFYTVAGSVKVVDVLVGDVNSDGSVDNLDRLILTRYLANWKDYTEDIINSAAADVNCDGSVDNLDRLILTRHLANWSGYEELPLVSKE